MSLLDDLEPPAPEPKREPAAKRTRSTRTVGGLSPEERARLYIAKMPEAIQGSDGSGACFNVAMALVHKFGLDDATSLRIMEEDYNPRCVPPTWTRKELEHKITSAREKGRNTDPVEDREAPLRTNGASMPEPPAGRFPDDDVDVEQESAILDDGEKPPAESSALESHWIDLGAHLEWLTERPPEQVWLLKRWHDGRDHGVFPRGRTGLLNATGGLGKTYLVTQTAMAVASGGFLLETLRSVEAGHVLLALAEEDADEARRRISRTVNASGFDDEQRRAVAERLHVLPLAGVQVALMCSPALGVMVTSDFAHALRNKLNGYGVDWSLIVLDPLVRWAADGVEQNNSIATRFVQILETFTTVRGNPSVLVAHHSSLDSVQNGKSRGRGVTAIRDAFRWEVSMDGVESPDGAVEGVILRNSKSNYSLKFKPMALVRNTEPGIEGTLRLANAAEEEALKLALPKERQTVEQRAKETKDRKRSAFEADSQAVLALLPVEPAHVSGTAVETALKAAGTPRTDKTIRGILERLVAEGLVRDLSNGAQSKPRQWARTSGATSEVPT